MSDYHPERLEPRGAAAEVALIVDEHALQTVGILALAAPNILNDVVISPEDLVQQSDISESDQHLALGMIKLFDFDDGRTQEETDQMKSVIACRVVTLALNGSFVEQSQLIGATIDDLATLDPGDEATKNILLTELVVYSEHMFSQNYGVEMHETVSKLVEMGLAKDLARATAVCAKFGAWGYLLKGGRELNIEKYTAGLGTNDPDAGTTSAAAALSLKEHVRSAKETDPAFVDRASCTALMRLKKERVSSAPSIVEQTIKTLQTLKEANPELYTNETGATLLGDIRIACQQANKKNERLVVKLMRGGDEDIARHFIVDSYSPDHDYWRTINHAMKEEGIDKSERGKLRDEIFRIAQQNKKEIEGRINVIIPEGVSKEFEPLADHIWQSADPRRACDALMSIVDGAESLDEHRQLLITIGKMMSMTKNIHTISRTSAQALKDPDVRKLFEYKYMDNAEIDIFLAADYPIDTVPVLKLMDCFKESVEADDQAVAVMINIWNKQCLLSGDINVVTASILQLVESHGLDDPFAIIEAFIDQGEYIDPILKLARHLQTPEERNYIAKKTLASSPIGPNILLNNVTNFKDLDGEVLRGLIVADGVDISSIVNRIDRFPVSDHNLVARLALESGSANDAIHTLSVRGLPRMKDLDPKIADELIVQHGCACQVMDNLASFKGLTVRSVELMMVDDSVNLVELAKAVMNYDKSIMPRPLAKASDLFGKHLNFEMLTAVKLILDGKYEDKLFDGLDITVGGETGCAQLGQSLRVVTSGMFKTGDIPKDLLNNPLVLNFIRMITRSDVTDWKVNSQTDFLRFLNMPHEMPSPEYQYQEIKVGKRDRKKSNEFSIPQDAAEEYASLLEDLDFIQQPGSLESLVEVINELIDQRVDLLQQQGVAVDESVESIAQHFPALVGYKEFHRPLRRRLLMRTMELHGEANLSPLKGSDIKPIITMKDYAGHLSLEAWGGQIKKRDLQLILETKALDHAIKLANRQNEGLAGTVTFGVLPVRGALMELSGQISDACWSSRYDSITKSFPNMTAVMFVKNPGKKEQRFAGGAMLIETESKAGEKLLVIRGLNPLQTDINMLNKESFFAAFGEYVRKTAEATGRKPAIVIDGEAALAATNRPELFNYLTSIVGQLKKVLINDPKATFNAHSINNCTYLI